MSKLHDLVELQSKLVLDRINQSEKNVHLITASLEGIVKKESKFCNKIDELANKFKGISDSEAYDASLEQLFDTMSTATVHLADIESNKISRIENKLMNDLIQCEVICRSTRDEIKNLSSLRDFELNKRSQFNLSKKTRKNALVENEIMLSNIQMSKIIKELTATAEKFESQKFNNIKEIMLNFMLIQLKYFASGIEILSEAYESVSNISDESEKFSEELKGINKQFKKSIEQENHMHGNRFSFVRNALSKFSHSASNIDHIGRQHDFKRSDADKTKSSLSLNFLEHDLKSDKNPSDDEESTDSDDSDTEESSNATPTDTDIVKRK